MKMLLQLLVLTVFSNQIHASIVINSGEEFKTTIENWSTLSEAEKTSRWNLFESKYQTIYDDLIYIKEVSGWESRLEKKRAFFFENLPTIQNKMIEIFDDAENIVRSKEALFKTLFPDLKDNIPVYILPSIFSFNGKVALIKEHNRTALLIGADFVSYRNDNLDVLFSHEFFHAYHEDKLPPNSTGQTMATPLWKEGFGTYVSGVLNPTQNDDVLLMDPALAEKCQDPIYLAELARLYQIILKTDGETTYDNWFLMNGENPIKRRGYCLGLQVVRKIAEHHDILDMTTWREERFTKEITIELDRLSSQN